MGSEEVEPRIHASALRVSTAQALRVGLQAGLMMGALIALILMAGEHRTVGLAARSGARFLLAGAVGAALVVGLANPILRSRRQETWAWAVVLLPATALIYALGLGLTEMLTGVAMLDHESAIGGDVLEFSMLVAIFSIWPLPFGVFCYPSFVAVLLWARRRLRSIAMAEQRDPGETHPPDRA